jgi:hypothetical protein
MKKLIGVIAILLTLLLCAIYRQLTSRHAKAKPETVYVPEKIQDGLFLTTLMMQ